MEVAILGMLRDRWPSGKESSRPGFNSRSRRGSLSWSFNTNDFFFICVRCDLRAKSSGRWLLGSPPSAVVRQLAPRAWCPLQCLQAKTVDVLSPGVDRFEECAQVFAPQSHIHNGLNQQDLVSSEVFFSPQ